MRLVFSLLLLIGLNIGTYACSLTSCLRQHLRCSFVSQPWLTRGSALTRYPKISFSSLGSTVPPPPIPYRKGIFCIPTSNTPFRNMLKDAEVRDDFIRAFVPGAKVIKSHLRDASLNPIQARYGLEEQSDALWKLCEDITKASHTTLKLDGQIVKNPGLKTLKDLAKDASDILRSVTPLKGSKADIICDVEYEDKTEGLTLIEIQVVPPVDYNWDARTLYYLAGIYFQQLRVGDKYSNVKRVIGVNILGGESRRGKKYDWKTRFKKGEIRHYQFIDRFNPMNTIPYIELFQYPIHLLQGSTSVDQNWIHLLTHAQYESERVLKDESLSLAIRKAYKIIKEDNLTIEDRESYIEEIKQFEELFTTGKAEGKAEGLVEGKARCNIEIAKRMLELKLDLEMISATTGLTREEIEALGT